MVHGETFATVYASLGGTSSERAPSATQSPRLSPLEEKKNTLSELSEDGPTVLSDDPSDLSTRTPENTDLRHVPPGPALHAVTTSHRMLIGSPCRAARSPRATDERRPRPFPTRRPRRCR